MQLKVECDNLVDALCRSLDQIRRHSIEITDLAAVGDAGPGSFRLELAGPVPSQLPKAIAKISSVQQVYWERE